MSVGPADGPAAADHRHYLPALPQMQQDLRLSPAQAQATLCQADPFLRNGPVDLGPHSDRWGRKVVLRSGLGLFVLASVLTVLAQDGHTMVLARVAQGACLSATVMCGRAMIRRPVPHPKKAPASWLAA